MPAGERSCLVTLARTQSLISTHLARRLRRHGLSPAAFNALQAIERAGSPLAPHELGELLLVTKGAVTGLADSLVRAGLVRRVPHPRDRRMVLIELTAAGRRLLREVEREHEAGERQLLGCLDQAERQALLRILGKLQTHLQHG